MGSLVTAFGYGFGHSAEFFFLQGTAVEFALGGLVIAGHGE